MSLLRSIATVGGFTMASRVLGFVRDILIAAVLGAGFVADAFFVAFKLPNLFRRLFAEGTFSAAFVPLYAGKLEGEGKARARAFAEEAFAVLLLALFLFVAASELLMPYLMVLFAPGFLAVPAKFELAVELTRVTFPYLLFISAVALMSGVLNSLGRFAAAAAAPIVLNLSLIGAILWFARTWATPGHALAWGVFAAGVLQFAWLYGACGRAGVWLRPSRPRLTSQIRLLFRRTLPVALGAGVYQVNLAADMIIASLLPSGSISYLFYADRVTQLPLGVIGVAVGTALLPLLSRQLRAGQFEAAAHSQSRALEFAFLLTLPASLGLMVIADPLINVFFQRGAFGAVETKATAAALAVYAASLQATVVAKALTPAFFAREDTATPVKISIVSMVANIALALLFMKPLLHVGIALATTLSALLNAGLLAYVLWRRGWLATDVRFQRRLPRAALASGGMALLLWVGVSRLQPVFQGTLGERVMALAALVIGGALVFGLLATVLGAARPADLRSLFGRQARG